MGEGPEIPLARLREVTELLLAHLERAGASVTLEHDLFGLVWLADVLRALGHQSIG